MTKEKELVLKLRQELSGGRLTISDLPSINYVTTHKLGGKYYIKDIQRCCIIGSLMTETELNNLSDCNNNKHVALLLQTNSISALEDINRKFLQFILRLQRAYDKTLDDELIENDCKLNEFECRFYSLIRGYGYEHYLPTEKGEKHVID